jgi:hypothetical protein
MSSGASQNIKLSAHCIIDHLSDEIDVEKTYPIKSFLSRLLLVFDGKMHFTGLRGILWRVIGINRSTKNPNICNL